MLENFPSNQLLLDKQLDLPLLVGTLDRRRGRERDSTVRSCDTAEEDFWKLNGHGIALVAAAYSGVRGGGAPCACSPLFIATKLSSSSWPWKADAGPPLIR